MPTVWIDPFIAGAVALSDTSILGHGTDTVNYNTAASRTGTYLNPFRFDDWQSNSQTATTVNGVTIAADTEVRIKGKPMSDMTTSMGEVYLSGGYIYPESGNTTYATVAGSSDVYNNWLHLSGSNIDDMYPNVSGIVKFPLILGFPASATSSSMQLSSTANDNDGRALYNAINEAGFTKFNQDGVAGNFCDLAFIKNGYLSSHALSNGDKYHWFSTNGLVTSSSAGWTSETEQNGYSLVSLSQSDTYERQYIRGQACTFDWSRLFLRQSSRRMYFRFQPMKAGVHHKIGQFMSAQNADYEQRMLNDRASTLEVGVMTGKNIQVDASVTGAISQVNLTISSASTLRLNSGVAGTNRMKFGSIYQRATTGTNARGFLSFNNRGTSTVEFLEGSSYYSQLSSANTSALNGDRSDYTPTNYVYPTNLYRAGLSGHWLSGISSGTAVNRNPKIGSLISTANNTSPFTSSLELTASNWWEIIGIRQDTTYSKLPIKDYGYLACGSSNYKTTANDISTVLGITLSTTSTIFPSNFAVETNDYDNKPLIIMPDTAGAAVSAGLAYNETVDSNEVVVLQNGGATGGKYVYGLEVQVPSDFNPAGSDTTKDNARIQLILSRSSNVTNAVNIYYFYRSNTSNETINTAVTHTTISSDQTAPTSIIHNIITPASGLRAINSVLVFIEFLTATSNTSERLYIHDAYAETY